VAIEQTLSRDDVTAQGQGVAFDRARFLRSDPKDLQAYVLELREAGLLDDDEARSILGIAAASSASDLQPGTV
jgi:hypothetical protein